MNAVYLKSLASYCGFNTVVWFLLMFFTATPMTVSSLLISTAIAVVFHRVFVWKK